MSNIRIERVLDIVQDQRNRKHEEQGRGARIVFGSHKRSKAEKECGNGQEQLLEKNPNTFVPIREVEEIKHDENHSTCSSNDDVKVIEANQTFQDFPSSPLIVNCDLSDINKRLN